MTANSQKWLDDLCKKLQYQLESIRNIKAQWCVLHRHLSHLNWNKILNHNLNFTYTFWYQKWYLSKNRPIFAHIKVDKHQLPKLRSCSTLSCCCIWLKILLQRFPQFFDSMEFFDCCLGFPYIEIYNLFIGVPTVSLVFHTDSIVYL